MRLGFGQVLRTGLKWALRIGATVCVLVALLLVAYRFVPPVSTLMLARWATLRGVDRQWLPLDRISPNLAAAVVTSEDGRFCRDAGVDWGALREVIRKGGVRGPSRGASTIHMQTAKNLFLWPARSFIRKGLEIPLALTINLLWPKRRVMEVYLNIAEWGNGVFGAEAAARRYFKKSAADLTPREAALVAAALPNPMHRNAAAPSGMHGRLATLIMVRAREPGDKLDCLR
ncbi:MAG: monofunctional biosynthetic peptidoglycan transglycosylase [Methylobacteriaceae bacterium]|nr:monofunctional biosynthetic peptidoglycan transglycosylase [Methylobacteriaceae bacterium]